MDPTLHIFKPSNLNEEELFIANVILRGVVNDLGFNKEEIDGLGVHELYKSNFEQYLDNIVNSNIENYSSVDWGIVERVTVALDKFLSTNFYNTIGPMIFLGFYEVANGGVVGVGYCD